MVERDGREPMVVGVISDTHGLLRPEAIEALRGADRIVHAGDVDDPEILERLAGLAPVDAVRGNVDRGGWARELPETTVVEVAGRSLYVLHRLETLDLSPAAAGFDAVIYGHTHQPSEEWRDRRYLGPPVERMRSSVSSMTRRARPRGNPRRSRYP